MLILAALAATALPIRVHAQFTGTATATGQYESDSNVFDLPSGISPPGGNDSRRGDTFFAYGARLDGSYLLDRQELYAAADTKEYEYHRFTDLDHDDYKLDAGINWKLADIFNGKFDVARSHSMVPFYDLSGSSLALSLVTEQRETAQLGVLLNSNWTIQAGAFTSKSDEPVLEAPNLELTQNSGTASLEYLGITGLTTGFLAGYLSGHYQGASAVTNPSFSQSTAGLLARYMLSRLTVEGEIGYSHRSSETGADDTSGIIGMLDFTEQLTPKTSFTGKIDRTINSYILNAGSEIDTALAASINWQATYKLAVSPGYTFTYRNYPGQGNNPVGSDRVDIQEVVTLNVDYRPQRWLLIKPYANVQTRRSTFIGGHYSSSVFGVTVTVTPYTHGKKR